MGEFKMRVIVPAAGLSTRFPDMKPKYLLYDYKHELMIANAIRPFIQNAYKVTIGILKEHDEKYNATEYIKHEFGNTVDVVVLDEPTKGPADTVYQIIEKLGLYKEPIFIKDCDSFFDHDISDGNYVCVSKISQHEVLKKLASKSFTVSNNQGIITDIVEKEVVSDTFCVGGYKFSSALLYKQAFKRLTNNREVFVSDVIGMLIGDMQIFNEVQVTNYTDVGTAQDWFEYNDKPVVFCDIDGTIIKCQSRVGENSYGSSPIILEKNVQRLLELQNKGAQILFTTARKPLYMEETRKLLDDLGFEKCRLIMGLLNSRRILINDFNTANPYPRAEAVNIFRDTDELNRFL
jgi:hydroxymethylpyrimidine pyrophosphatase-like HAD family hydrolase